MEEFGDDGLIEAPHREGGEEFIIREKEATPDTEKPRLIRLQTVAR